VPGYEASGWQGMCVPKSTPTEIIEKLNKEINAGLADPKIKTSIADLGSTVLAGSPADFGRLIADETEKWAKVIKFAASSRSDPQKSGSWHRPKFHKHRSANASR
jgi:tripartite-type tricarboxylate transporter receptor subunit TctC